jgi:hypothetical protein
MASHPATLERLSRERLLHHRALLLYAMQHPERRSTRAVARAVARSESTIRGWAKQWSWDLRSEVSQAEETAIAIYRRDYLRKHGATELPEIESNVALTLSASPAQEPPPSTVAEDLRRADQKVQREILRRRDDRQKTRSKHVDLVDGALGYLVKQLQDGKVRANLRDIPVLLQTRALLTGEAEEIGATGALGVETVRVRMARESGGDLIDAMSQDLDECRVILGALRTRQEAGIEEQVEEARANREPLRVVEGGAE